MTSGKSRQALEISTEPFGVLHSPFSCPCSLFSSYKSRPGSRVTFLHSARGSGQCCFTSCNPPSCCTSSPGGSDADDVGGSTGTPTPRGGAASRPQPFWGVCSPGQALPLWVLEFKFWASRRIQAATCEDSASSRDCFPATRSSSA